MPQHDFPAPGSPEDWLTRAKSNLARAASPRPDGALLEDSCYDAQQAAEKSLTLLCSRGIVFRHVHDIGELLDALAQGVVVVPDHVRKASVLTAYAVQTRCPGDYEPVSETEFREVLEMATHVFDWAKAAIVNR